MASLGVSGSKIALSVGNNDVVYYRFNESEEFKQAASGTPEELSVTGSTLSLYSKGSVRNLCAYVIGDGAISSVDVSKLTGLERLKISSGSLTSLNVSKNTALTRLELDDCNLSVLDVSGNTRLTALLVRNNKLSALDLSRNNKLTELDVRGNDIKTFDALKVNPGIDSGSAIILAGGYAIDKLPVTVKAGEVLDLSKYAKCGAKKSSYRMLCPEPVLTETDNDFKFVFGNAYAGKDIQIELTNDDSYASFVGTVKVTANPDAPAAPEKAKGDVPVDDISGTIVSAESAKDFDAQEVVLSDGKYVLGEKVNKDDLRLSISPISAGEALYDRIAAADKSFQKDKARLLAYDITLSHNGIKLIKLKDGINLTIRYPSDMAKDWNKYNYKVYHFVTFDYDKLENLATPRIEEIKCTADKNGIHFKSPNFSNYAISVTPKSAGTSSPGTGESTVPLNIVICVIIIAAAGISGVLAKRRGELYTI